MSHNPCTFDELKKRDGPPLNAWGLWGADNEYGRLNLITPEAVKRGRDAVKHGIPVNLNLPLIGPTVNPHRGCVKHTIENNGYYLDDRVELNTQCSTQWDGMNHVPYQNYPTKGEYLYHGGQTTEQASDPKNYKFSISNFAKRPITTRAHLLDIVKYLADTGKPALKALSTENPVSLETLLACAKAEGVEFAPGDVLIVRTGFTEAIYALSEAELAKYDPMQGGVGVEASEEFMRWAWDTGLAAVAGDTFAFENWPPNFASGKPCIHEVFLAGWGCPLGELFDLRELAKKCAELKQYTFFLTTMTLNLDGGIASPPNAQAIL